MKVFVDGLGLPIRGGARSSMLGWLAALGRYGAQNSYVVFLSRPEPMLDQFPHVEQRIVPIRDRFVLRIWAQLNLPLILRREKSDLFHAMKNLSVFGLPCRSIITVNDLTHIVLSHLFPRIDGVYWRQVQRLMLDRIDHIIAISHNTKWDLIRTYQLPDDKVSVIYPACDEVFHPGHDYYREQLLRAKYSLTNPLLLYVGGLAIHKNLHTLVQAFALISDRIPHTLAIVGGKHHTSSYSGLDKLVNERGLTQRVRFLGTVPDEDLPHLYRMADLFTLPSLNEGFGLALLESMACSTAALASRCSSLPEVGNDAVAWIEEPTNASEWSKALLNLLRDHQRRDQLRVKGLAQAHLFSWRGTAERTLALYQQIVTA